ncbi:hypothetical protein H7J77_12300 [Mycolicibacillus parakoreensis]|uniref:Uncharacterized protein n=1 Tax=Mycolicibacillus parakoreensis TaxID=1069221 RepID=A0ABY3TXW7_9MYCO|nr:hypothetical protein [Mycolicibacillus parakoreensis]MCV7316317.1 hypothetical protein [Mycolicibacillus parakoreensis]ULN52563.1 hypothetical protein MIU77_17280 [Mycolicibacillus parakoreensis]
MSDLDGVTQLDQPDPRGILALRNLPDDLQAAEDSTQSADFVRELNWQWWQPGTWSVGTYDDVRQAEDAALNVLRAVGFTPAWSDRLRPATDAERTLLAYLDYELPDELYTVVSFPSPGVRCRRFPQIEGAAP